MKLKNIKKMPKNTSHLNLINGAGKQSKMTIKTFAATSEKDFGEFGIVQIEFLKKVKKGFDILGVYNVESSAIVTEAIAAMPVKTPTMVPGAVIPVHVGDVTQAAVATWNVPIPQDKIDLKTCDLAKWDVEPKELTLPGNVASGLSMLVCSDNGQPLGKVNAAGDIMGRIAFNPKSYHVYNNAKLLALTQNIVAALDKIGVAVKPVTCGSFSNRSRVFVTLSIDKHDTFKIGNREFKQYIDLLNSFDKTTQVVITNSSICVCCKNTFREALKDETGAFKFSVSHDKNMELPLSEVPKMMQIIFKCQENFKAKLQFWHGFGVSLTQAEQVFAAFLGKPANEAQAESLELSTRAMNTIETAKGLFAKGAGNKGETALDVFSAVTDFYTHSSAGGEDINKQAESSEFGAGQRAKLEFFECLTAATESKQSWIGTCRIGEKILLATAKAIKAKAQAK